MAAAPLDMIRNSPITSLTTAESLVAGVLTFLTTHGIFGDIDVSTTTQTIAPFVALLIPAVFGSAKWRLVTPFAKVKDLAERDGLVSDADFARLGAMLEEKLNGWTGIDDESDGSDEDGEPTDDGSDVAVAGNGFVDAPFYMPEHQAVELPAGPPGQPA